MSHASETALVGPRFGSSLLTLIVRRIEKAMSGLLLFGVGSFLAACDGPVHAHHYRLTLEVEANGEIHSASSVVEVRKFVNRRLDLSPGIVNTSVVGEATLVDLGDRRVLIALLAGIPEPALRAGRRVSEWVGEDPTNLLARLYGVRLEWDGFRNAGLMELSRQRGARRLEITQVPTLVTFGSIDDPKSLILVDPENIALRLDEQAQLKRATIEITDAPVTTGISKRLPWLDRVAGKYIAGISGPAASADIHGGHFRRGAK